MSQAGGTINCKEIQVFETLVGFSVFVRHQRGGQGKKNFSHAANDTAIVMWRKVEQMQFCQSK